MRLEPQPRDHRDAKLKADQMRKAIALAVSLTLAYAIAAVAQVSVPTTVTVVSGDGSTLTPPANSTAALPVAIAAAGAAIAIAHVSVPAPVTVISSDGTVVEPPKMAALNAAAPAASQRIFTVEGVWTFGGAPVDQYGDYPLLLNGSAANGGNAALLEVLHGNLYAFDKADGTYSSRVNGAWVNFGSTAPSQGTVATAVSLSGVTAQLLDNAPAGTVVATATVTMSPAAAQFTGVLVSSNPLYAAQGMKVVLARDLAASDDGTQNATITAVQ